MQLDIYWGDGPSPCRLTGRAIRVRLRNGGESPSAQVTVDGVRQDFTYVVALELCDDDAQAELKSMPFHLDP